MSPSAVTYEGSCLCGQIRIQVTGPPISAGYCHCKTCRVWHAAPLNAYATWPDKAVHITEGEELLESYQDRRSNRHWCSHCGSGLLNRLANDRTVVSPWRWPSRAMSTKQGIIFIATRPYSICRMESPNIRDGRTQIPSKNRVGPGCDLPGPELNSKTARFMKKWNKSVYSRSRLSRTRTDLCSMWLASPGARASCPRWRIGGVLALPFQVWLRMEGK